MKYVSLDIETTGLDPKTCQVLQVALVVENTDADPLPPVEDLLTLDLGLWATSYTGEPYALGLNEKLLTALRAVHGVESEAEHNGRTLRIVRNGNGWLEVKSFLETLGKKTTAAGKNVAGFDLKFVAHAAPDVAAMFSHRTIDVGSVAMGAKSDFWNTGVPSMGDLLETEVVHDALHDARDNIRVIRRLTSNYGRGENSTGVVGLEVAPTPMPPGY